MSTEPQHNTPVSAELVALPQCPFPCGWSGLHKIAVQDAAYLAKVQWPEDEEGVNVPRATAMRSMDYLIQVCRTMLNAAPVAAQAQPDQALPYETALAELIGKIVPGLDSGDILADAHQASMALAQAQQPVSGTSQRTEANNRRKALLENQGKGEVPSWTGHGDADAALIMLDRLDVSGGDNDRVDEISAIIRNLAAKQDQFRDAAQMIEPSGNSGELPSDEDLIEFATEEQFILFCDEDEFLQIAKSVLQRFGHMNADKVDAERWRAYRAAIAAEDSAFLGRGESYLSSLGLRAEVLPTEGQIDAAIDAARKEHNNA